MGLFGGNRRKALGSAIDIGAIQDQARLEGDGTLPTMPKRPGLFGQGGKGWDVLGGTVDTLLQMRGAPPVYDDGSSERLRQLILQAQIAQQTHQANRQFDIENPLPQQPDAFERQLAAIGIMPGTPEYQEYMKKRVTNSIDPVHLINDPVKGAILVGGSYGYPESVQNDGYDELPPGFQLDGGAGPQTPRPFP